MSGQFGDSTGKQRELYEGQSLNSGASNSIIDILKKIPQECLAEVIGPETFENQGSSPFYKVKLLEEGIIVNAILYGPLEEWTSRSFPKNGDRVYVRTKSDYYYVEIIGRADNNFDQELAMKESPHKTKHVFYSTLDTILKKFNASWFGSGNGPTVGSTSDSGGSQISGSVLGFGQSNASTMTDEFFKSPYKDGGSGSKIRVVPTGLK